MKRILTTLCALAFVMAGSIPALAAEADADTGQSASYYPISVEEYTYGSLDEPRVEKVYQLSLSDDPSGIPTEDFVRNGRLYYLLDMTRKNEVGVDTKPHIETISQASDTNDMETILQQLNAELEVTTEDGYTGILHLDHTTVKVTADGYATKTQALSASRSYPNLSEADVSLIPKSIEERGNTLTLADVQWDSSEQTDGAGGIAVKHNGAFTEERAYIFESLVTATLIKRTVIPRGSIQERDDVSENSEDLLSYTPTIKALPDADGNTSYVYYYDAAKAAAAAGTE